MTIIGLLNASNVRGKDRIDFIDSYKMLQVVTSRVLKSTHLCTLFNIKIFGKTLSEHHIDLYKDVSKIGGLPKEDYHSPVFGLMQRTMPIASFNFSPDNLELQQNHIFALLEYVYQKYVLKM